MKQLRISPDLQVPLEAVTQTFAILAKRGSGKTYTAAVFAEELLKAGLHTVIIDPVGVWWGLRAAANGKDEGLPILVMGGDHGDVPLEHTAGELVAEVIVEQGRSVVLDVSQFRKGELVQFATAFLEALYRRNRAPLQLIVDEADAIAPQRPQPNEARMLGAMEDVVRRGRARGLGCTLITQRPAVLNKNVLTQIEVLICLRLISPQDRKALSDWVEVHGTPEQLKALNESLPSLPIGTAWFWSPGWLDTFQKVKVRKRETFDSSSTPKAGEHLFIPKRLAPVDLDALREAMAATIEEAKASDPKELKRRIAELETECRGWEKRAHVANSPAPLISSDDVDEFLAKGLELQKTLDAVLRRVGSEPAPRGVALRPSDLANGKAQAPTPAKVQTPSGQSPKPTANGDVQPRHQAILDALASFELLRLADVSKGQLAVFCERSPQSSGWANDLGALRSAGRIHYPSGGRVQLTEIGRALARAGVRYSSLQELHGVWFRKLQPRQADIVRELVAIYPEDMRKEDLAEAAGKSFKSSGFANDLGALRSLGLLDYPSGGRVVATELLFPPLPK